MASGRDREKYNKYMREYMLDRYHKRRSKAIEILGGECVRCGDDENLEIDHQDADDKEFTVGGSDWNLSEDQWRKELEKCQLLCVSCHRKKTVENGEHFSQSEERYEGRVCGCGEYFEDVLAYAGHSTWCDE